MPCHSAMMKNVLLVYPDDTVEDTLSKMKKKKADMAVVLDEQGDILGYMDMPVLLKNLLPVSLSMQMPGQSLGGVVIGAAPGIAKRLRKVRPLPVDTIMERNFNCLSPGTPVWEGVQMLVELGSPIFITEEGSSRYVGVMNEVSALEELERIQDE